MITLVQSGDGSRILLGRQPVFPPNFYSCLAGYMEAAESIEDAARREIYEESRVKIRDVCYYGSQPWPIGRGVFNQVMIGCVGTAETEEITIDTTELSDARWFTREEVQRSLMHYYKERPEGGSAAGRSRSRSPSPSRKERTAASGEGASATTGAAGAQAGDATSASAAVKLRLPGPFAIAHQLIKAWVMGDLK